MKNHGLILVLCVILGGASGLGAYVSDYDLYALGAKGNALGGAFTAVADDTSALYWNPAGLVRQQSFIMTYLLDSQFLLGDLRETFSRSFKVTYKVPPLVGAVLPLSGRLAPTVGLSVSAPVQRKLGYGEDGFYMVQTAPSFAFMPVQSLSVGVAMGILTSNLEWGFGLAGQAGILWAPEGSFRFGAVFRSPVSFRWNDREGFYVPFSSQAGTAVRLKKDVFLSFDVEYQDWRSARWKTGGVNRAYAGETGLFRTILPRLGLSFIEKKYGAQIRLGVAGRSELDDGLLKPLYLLSLGVGARAMKVLRFEGCLVDGFLFSLFLPGQRPVETIQLSCEYVFD